MGLLIFILFLLIVLCAKAISYWNSSYYNVTHNSFSSTSFDAGVSGEYKIYKALRSYEPAGARFVFNCYLPTDSGNTAEIDAIMIYTSGIFVFESKNYSGWIFGSELNQMWTQTLPGRGEVHKEQFYNPIMQNRTHIKWLRQQIGDSYPIHNIIVFSNHCELKDLAITSEDVSVIQLKDILKTIHSIHATFGACVEQQQIDQIYGSLLPYAATPAETKEAHVANTKKTYQQSHFDADNPIKVCPRCGANLVLRTAKQGFYAGNQFYGCSNYPACRYIENLVQSN